MDRLHYTCDSPQRLAAVLAQISRLEPTGEHPLEITVGEWCGKRSTEQNRRYWALLTEIAEQVWLPHNGGRRQFSAEAWHHEFAGRFLGHQDLPSGRLIPVSTSKLDVAEFGDYMSAIEAFATQELGVTFSQ